MASWNRYTGGNHAMKQGDTKQKVTGSGDGRKFNITKQNNQEKKGFLEKFDADPSR